MARTYSHITYSVQWWWLLDERNYEETYHRETMPGILLCPCSRTATAGPCEYTKLLIEMPTEELNDEGYTVVITTPDFSGCPVHSADNELLARTDNEFVITALFPGSVDDIFNRRFIDPGDHHNYLWYMLWMHAAIVFDQRSTYRLSIRGDLWFDLLLW